MLVRQLEQPAGLLQALARLHGDGPLETRLHEQRLQIRRQEIPADRPIRLHPGILGWIEFPKMLMSVETHRSISVYALPSLWRQMPLNVTKIIAGGIGEKQGPWQNHVRQNDMGKSDSSVFPGQPRHQSGIQTKPAISLDAHSQIRFHESMEKGLGLGAV